MQVNMQNMQNYVGYVGFKKYFENKINALKKDN